MGIGLDKICSWYIKMIIQGIILKQYSAAQKNNLHSIYILIYSSTLRLLPIFPNEYQREWTGEAFVYNVNFYFANLDEVDL